MKIKEGFLARKIGEQTVVVAVGKASKDFNGMVKLNEVGDFLWNELKEDKTEEQLVDALLEKYNVDKESAKIDVDAFVKNLEESGIVE